MEKKVLNLIIIEIIVLLVSGCGKTEIKSKKTTNNKTTNTEVVENSNVEVTSETENTTNTETTKNTAVNTNSSTTKQSSNNNSSANTSQNNQTTNNNTNVTNNNQVTNSKTETNQQACTTKKFSQKYTYVYSTLDECKHQGNNDFFNVSDNINTNVFAFDCDQIIDECGTTWYGVRFMQWDENGSMVDFYY